MTNQTIASAAEEVFRLLERPLHYRKLTKLIIGKCDLIGRTPHESVRSRLSTNPKFKRVAEGVYALAEWDQYPVARFAKDIAFDILENRGGPMNMDALGQAILDERKFVGGPRQVVRNVLRTDKRFIYDRVTELVSLAKWATNE